MMTPINIVFSLLMLAFLPFYTLAQDTLELETTIIKGNKELPKILYVVPWNARKNTAKKEEQSLQLHSLFGDLFDPIVPGDIESKNIERK